MSEQTQIEWATHTGGPYLGCAAVSPGCVNCYAWALAESRLKFIFHNAYRKAGLVDWEPLPVWGKTVPRVLATGFWSDARRINAKHAKARTRGRWFPSMIDWLDDMPGGIIDQDGKKLDPIAVLSDFLKLIHDTPNLDWLLLTKRPENFRSRLSSEPAGLISVQEWLNGKPPPNVWIGVSVEDQKRADERIPELLKIPAKVRFLSVEPLLGMVQLGLNQINYDRTVNGPSATNPSIDWVIVGGESGPGARPCNMEWIRSVVWQCQSAGVPCFVKQLGSIAICDNANMFDWPDEDMLAGYGDGFAACRLMTSHPKGGDPAKWPEDLRVREFPC